MATPGASSAPGAGAPFELPAIWVKKLPDDEYKRVTVRNIPTAFTTLRSVRLSPDMFDLLFQGLEQSVHVLGQVIHGESTENLRNLAPSADNLYFLVVKGHKFDAIIEGALLPDATETSRLLPTSLAWQCARLPPHSLPFGLRVFLHVPCVQTCRRRAGLF